MAKPEHMNKISHVQTTSVKTGIGNTLGEGGREGRDGGREGGEGGREGGR